MTRTLWEKIEGNTEQILAELRRLVDEGNARRVVVRQAGKTIAEFPLTAGVIGAVIAPVAAAIGALGALLTDCTIEVEKGPPDEAPPPPPDAAA
ncbi:MAG: DUF4342 domain-containing protein [Acidobacteriota bacterium]